MVRRDYLAFGRPNFSDDEIVAVGRVLRSGWVGIGDETQAFERELSAHLDVPHVVTVNSCTSALFLALLVNGVGPGDEVICPSLTFCATANAALYLGATPVFCDVDPDTLTVSSVAVQERLTPRTKAIVVVHFGGLATDMESVRAVLPEGTLVVEDAAHAFGARFPDGKLVGSSGNLTCFSFYANKNLSTGDGGAIALFDAQLAERLRSLRQNGMSVDAWKRFMHPNALMVSSVAELGYKMNYTDLQAAIGRVQLRRQGEFDAVRLEVAKCYYEGLGDLRPEIRFQRDVLHPYHARHLFVISLPTDRMRVSRDEFLARLRSVNIGASIHYAPLHQMPLYAARDQVCLPCTEKLANSILTLPISASMTLTDAEYVVESFRQLYKSVVF